MRAPMQWEDLPREAAALRDAQSETAVGIAARGARLLHRALTELYLGEPEPLRAVAWTIAEARPEVVALRNVGVSAYRTAREARTGDRMAAAARGVARLARLLADTPASLARRGQPLLPDGAIVTTLGRSESVRAAVALAGDRIDDVRVIPTPAPALADGERGAARRDSRETSPPEPSPSLQTQGNTQGRHSVSESTQIPPDDLRAALTDCDIVLLGCTAFLADGSMAADAGTLALVAAAAGHDPPIPVHFLADTLKLAPWLPAPQDGAGTAAQPPLDIIPPEYVDHVITEDGIRRPGQLLRAAADLAGWWRMLETPE